MIFFYSFLWNICHLIENFLLMKRTFLSIYFSKYSFHLSHCECRFYSRSEIFCWALTKFFRCGFSITKLFYNMKKWQTLIEIMNHHTLKHYYIFSQSILKLLEMVICQFYIGQFMKWKVEFSFHVCLCPSTFIWLSWNIF